VISDEPKMPDISLFAEQLLAFQEELCPVGLFKLDYSARHVLITISSFFLRVELIARLQSRMSVANCGSSLSLVYRQQYLLLISFEGSEIEFCVRGKEIAFFLFTFLILLVLAVIFRCLAVHYNTWFRLGSWRCVLGLSHVCVNRGAEAKPVIVSPTACRTAGIGGRTHRFPRNNAPLPRRIDGMRSVRP
jgi:hypothetical protein